jgi:hypothetical protein
MNNTKLWYSDRQNEYCDKKQHLHDTLKMSGVPCEKMTFTYIAIPDYRDISKTIYFYILLPFYTGLESEWEHSNIKPWNQHYSFSNYSNNIPYLFVKDDFIYVPKEIFNTIFNSKNDILILCSYNDFSIQFPDITWISTESPPLCYFQYVKNEDKLCKVSFENWFKDKQSYAQSGFAFHLVNPMKKHNCFSTKDIAFTLNRCSSKTFFDVSLI